MNATAYSLAASLMRYFFIGLMGYVLVSVFISSISEYGHLRAARRLAGRELRFIEITYPEAMTGKVFDLGDELTIGRSDECDVVVKDKSMRNVHARIFERRGAYYIHSSKRRLSELNGGRLRGGRVRLHDGDRVWLSELCFVCRKRAPGKEEESLGEDQAR